MNKTEIVELALKILTELDQRDGQVVALETLNCGERVGEISVLLHRLSAAGIVTLGPGQEVSLCRSLSDLTALDVLQAVWRKSAEQRMVQVLYGAPMVFAVPFGSEHSEGRN